MDEFELCYRIEKDCILIPDLLSVEEPPLGFDFDYENALKFKLEYDFLPRAIMPKFIVKRHKDISNQLCWRTGVVLNNQTYQATAIIKADNKDAHIQIWVTGQQKRDYFASIRNTLWDIHNTFEKLDITELVPLPDEPKIFVSYKDLVGHYLENWESIRIGEVRKEYNVRKLLDGIEDINKIAKSEDLLVKEPEEDKPAPKHWYEKWGIWAGIFSAVTLAIVNIEKIVDMIQKIWGK